MAPRRRCPTCGSKQWHKEPSSGLIACSEGHILQNYRNETTEITEAGPHAMKKRTLKSGRKKREDKSKADPKLYHGARGRYHYFLCLQLLLRKQVATLTRLWDLPPEFETICRDVWALHLSLLPNPPPAEPYYHAQDMHGEGAPDKGGGRPSADTAKDKPDPNAPRKEDDSEGSSTEDDEESKKDSDKLESDEEGGDDADSELEALLREDSEISSSASSDGEHPLPVHKKGKRKGHSTDESPISTIAVLVVACWTLRIPVMLHDFTRLVELYQLPYLDPTIRIFPASLVQHLTKHNVQALSPRHAPATLAMHSIASKMAKRLYATYGVYTPECNAPCLLWRLTKEMAGSPTVYRLAKRTANVLSLQLTLHSSLGDEDTARHQSDNGPPEVALVACIIIVLKLVYGLDGQERVPKDEEDIGCAMGDAGEYLEEMKKMEAEDLGRKEARFSAKTNLRVGDMDEIELDSYIQFCEQALGGSDRGGERYFPMLTEGQGAIESASESDRRKLKGRGSAAGGLRAGAEYKIWNARDVDGTAAAEYGAVLQRGASVVGVAETSLGLAVNKFERQLVQWIAGRKRRARGRKE